MRNLAHLVDVLSALAANLVEDVETSFSLELENNSRLLEQVGVDITRGELASQTEVDSDELTESRRVVVTSCLGVTKSLHGGIGSDNLILKGSASLESRGVVASIADLAGSAESGNDGKILDNSLGVDSLASSGLASNQHGLIVSLSQHVVVGVIGNGEDMRRHFRLTLALVAADDVVVIDGQPLVRVDGNAEQTRVGVDQKATVSLVQVVDDGSFG